MEQIFYIFYLIKILEIYVKKKKKIILKSNYLKIFIKKDFIK